MRTTDREGGIYLEPVEFFLGLRSQASESRGPQVVYARVEWWRNAGESRVWYVAEVLSWEGKSWPVSDLELAYLEELNPRVEKAIENFLYGYNQESLALFIDEEGREWDE